MRRLEWKSPSEQLHKDKPDLSHLRILGCGAYVFIPKDVRKNKLSPKSELMIFIGYRQHHSNMMFMRSPNNVIFTAATALFDENLFPKCPTKSKVPPVTRIRDKKPEEPVVEIEFEDLSSEDTFTPPPIFPQGDDDGPHDDIVHHQPPHLPPPGDAPGGAPGGQRKSG